MCHGHAPFAKFPPMKVLLMTLQNPAPTLEDKGKRHFSKVGSARAAWWQALWPARGKAAAALREGCPGLVAQRQARALCWRPGRAQLVRCA
jgi:hypothetical protein